MNRSCHTIESLHNAVEQLSNVLRNERVQYFMTTFGKPNFRIWSKYMDMVDILLDFIGAKMDGNWTLHLEAFAIMLPLM